METAANKIYELTLELMKSKADKKDSVKTYNEEIKRIQSEIDSIISDEEAYKADEAQKKLIKK